MGFWRWTEGRQGTGYKVWTWASVKWPVKMDCHRIRYQQGAFIPPHTDPAPPGYTHVRLNLEMRDFWTTGGEFLIDGKAPLPIARFGTAKLFLFHPSEQTHEVTKVQNGSRWVWSIGWLVRIGT